MAQPAKRPIIIGVAGGTASGKTTVSRKILEMTGLQHLAYIEHDAYYRDLSHLPLDKRKELNFDHPDSLENEWRPIWSNCCRGNRSTSPCTILPNTFAPAN